MIIDLQISLTNKPKIFLLDVDGVMTTGEFLYSEEGKLLKIFGPDDHDALTLLKPYIDIRFITDFINFVHKSYI